MAFLSTLFSPCKYGIIPEIVPQNRISHCNGVIAATTYLAIIIGTFLASFLTQIFHRNFVKAAFACVLIALLGFVSSRGIEKTRPQSINKKISIRFLSDIFKTLKKAKKQRYLFTTLVFGSFFLFMGSYTQLNIIPFTLQSLKLSEVQGGYLFLMTAIGIGIGSYLAGQISGKEVELGFVPLATLGISLCFLGLFLFAPHFFVVVPLLMFMGVFGGFFIVPIDAFIQLASPGQDRGENVATANFLSFVGVIIASGLLALLGNGFQLSAAAGFGVMAILSLGIGTFLLLLYADQLLRLVVAKTMRFGFRISVKGKDDLSNQPPLLLIAPRSCWLDTFIVMSSLPRLVRYIVPLKTERKKTSLLYRLIKLIPIDMEHFAPLGEPTLNAIREEIKSGHSVCLMHPIDFPTETLQAWEEQLETLLQDIHVPSLPIHISTHEAAQQKGWLVQLNYLRKQHIEISYGSSGSFDN